MTNNIVRLGLVDSGVSAHQIASVEKASRFVQEMDTIQKQAVVPDKVGHGTLMCDIILYHAPEVSIYNAQVFAETGATSAATIAAAIDWLVAEKVDVINLSLGLRQDRAILKEACTKAVQAGLILFASAPAQGAPVFPSHYPDIIRTTGDARCDIGDISFLKSAQADFGACARPVGHIKGRPPRVGGASLGTAHVSGQVAGFLQKEGDIDSIWEWLESRAKYIHSERRTE